MKSIAIRAVGDFGPELAIEGKQRWNMVQKCETDCRDEIYTKMDGMLPKSIVWKGLLFIFMLWGIFGAIYNTGLTERKEVIKTNTFMSIANATNIAVIKNDLEYIRKAQLDTNIKLDTIMREARIENKRRDGG